MKIPSLNFFGVISLLLISFYANAANNNCPIPTNNEIREIASKACRGAIGGSETFGSAECYMYGCTKMSPAFEGEPDSHCLIGFVADLRTPVQVPCMQNKIYEGQEKKGADGFPNASIKQRIETWVKQQDTK